MLETYQEKMIEMNYLYGDETTSDDMFKRVSNYYGNDTNQSKRLLSYMQKLWFMPATPVLANGGTDRGLPISCFLNYVPDSRKGLSDHYSENIWLSSMGGGIGGYWGDIRSTGIATSRGSESTGLIPFVKVVDSQIQAFQQGKNRRGAYASWLRIDHPEVEEFLDIRKPTGGDINRKALNIHHGLVISEKFMELVQGKEKARKENTEFDDSFDLVDPHTMKVVKTVKATDLWINILENRISTGEPYIMFDKAVNDALPPSLKEKGLSVKHSNICSEITLPVNDDRTAVCCLASLNIETYDEWKNNDIIVHDIIDFLNNVLDDFIQKAPPELSRAVYSATRERSIGLGAMGFHSYLQKNNVPFESLSAKLINKEVFQHIYIKATEASIKLAERDGVYPDAITEGPNKDIRRNAHIMAIAPNASISIISDNTSPGIEPVRANSFRQKTKAGSNNYRNKYLVEVLKKYGKNDLTTWESIGGNKGSVSHLEYLSKDESDIFKTAIEINQKWLIELAADRQQYICQAQSLNLFFTSDVHKAYLHNIHMMAWHKGLKTLYYVRSEAPFRADDLTKKIERSPEIDYEDACVACAS